MLTEHLSVWIDFFNASPIPASLCYKQALLSYWSQLVNSGEDVRVLQRQSLFPDPDSDDEIWAWTGWTRTAPMYHIHLGGALWPVHRGQERLHGDQMQLPAPAGWHCPSGDPRGLHPRGERLCLQGWVGLLVTLHMVCEWRGARLDGVDPGRTLTALTPTARLAVRLPVAKTASSWALILCERNDRGSKSFFLSPWERTGNCCRVSALEPIISPVETGALSWNRLSEMRWRGV